MKKGALRRALDLVCWIFVTLLVVSVAAIEAENPERLRDGWHLVQLVMLGLIVLLIVYGLWVSARWEQPRRRTAAERRGMWVNFALVASGIGLMAYGFANDAKLSWIPGLLVVGPVAILLWAWEHWAPIAVLVALYLLLRLVRVRENALRSLTASAEARIEEPPSAKQVQDCFVPKSTPLPASRRKVWREWSRRHAEKVRRGARPSTN